MERSPWEANNFPVSQKIPCILWPKARNHIDNSQLFVSVLQQMNQVHDIPAYIFNIHFNINFPSMLGLKNWFFPSGFPTKTQYALLFFLIHAIYTNHLFLLDLPPPPPP